MGEFARILKLSSLSDRTGFRLDGEAANAQSGISVSSAGDVNGDGFADLIVGADTASPDGRVFAGTSYIVFGAPSRFPIVVNLSTLNGADGFRLDGAAPGDQSGISVSAAGDINGDSFGDLIIGADGSDPSGHQAAGSSYVVFGKATGFPSVVDLSTLNGTNGFELAGAVAGDRSGNAVSFAGDVNGDGFADVIVGAPSADPAGNDSAGSSYVIFGKTTGFAEKIDLASLDGTDGFRLDGAAADDVSGLSVSSAGDLNGDGFTDIIVGADGAGSNGRSDAGSSYVVFGHANAFSPVIDLASLNGATGFRLDGVAESDFSGYSVNAAGDVNGDGFADLVIGAYGTDSHGFATGSAYIVFGQPAFSTTFALAALDGANGFRVDGVHANDLVGFSVSAAGDVNGDGFDDVLVSSPGFDVAGAKDAGAAYLLFGKASGFDPTIELGALDGSNGFRIQGVAAFDHAGQSVSAAGDVNGDGFADLIVGAIDADPNGPSSGSTYVVFGHRALVAVTRVGTHLDNRINGGKGADNISGLFGNDTLIGWEAADTIFGGDGLDSLDGGGGIDNLDGGAGVDIMTGGLGNDFYTVDRSRDRVLEGSGEGRDTVKSLVSFRLGANVENLSLLGSGNLKGTGNSLANNIVGNIGNDVLSGLAGNDGLLGQDGKDTLKGGIGNDTMQGGIGDDIYVVGELGDKIIETFDGGTDIVRSSVDLTIGRNIENAVLIGRGDLSGVGNKLANSLIGNVGANALSGGNASDTISGGNGSDTIVGGAGHDVMLGGRGRDSYFVDRRSDDVGEKVGEGRDTIWSTVSLTLGANIENLSFLGTENLRGTGNSLANKLVGNDGSNILNGLAGADLLVGGAGNDRLYGGINNDTLKGGGGDDIYFVAAGDRVIEERNAGTDTVRSSTSFSLGKNVENIILGGRAELKADGNSLANSIAGNRGANTLSGGAASDRIAGRGGDDYIDGSQGSDLLIGGRGADTFVEGSQLRATNVDHIIDFRVSLDQFQLSHAVFSALSTGGLSDTQFEKGSGTPLATTVNTHILYSTTTGDLFYDPDGVGGMDQIRFAVLDNHPSALSASNFEIFM